LISQGRRFSGVPTSRASRELAASLGVPLLSDEGPWKIDLCVDGADEVNPELDLIKGGGGAHTREKIVNAAARRNLIIVDESKLSRRLGEQRAVSVEVLQFAHKFTAARLAGFGGPELRMQNGAPFITDSGQFLYDVRTGPIDNPAALERAILQIPGVVEVGLFCGRADSVIVAGASDIRELSKAP
jgi:ribose 5-phosphate isomerase A